MFRQRTSVLLIGLFLSLALVTSAHAFDLKKIGECIWANQWKPWGEPAKPCLLLGFGPDGVALCKETAGAVWTSADCDNAYKGILKAENFIDTSVAEGISDAMKGPAHIFECVTSGNIEGCINDFLNEKGLLYDPSLANLAILTGQAHFDMNVDFLPAGLEDVGVTRIIMPTAPDASKASNTCQRLVEVYYTGVELGQKTVSITTLDGRYIINVPACGPITYSIQAANPMFDWTPPLRLVTVGVTGPTTSGKNQAGGSKHANTTPAYETTATPTPTAAAGLATHEAAATPASSAAESQTSGNKTSLTQKSTSKQAPAKSK